MCSFQGTIDFPFPFRFRSNLSFRFPFVPLPAFGPFPPSSFPLPFGSVPSFGLPDPSGDNEIRTRDLLLARQALSQLSYTPKWCY